MKAHKTPSFRLDGKKALIPGGSSGIGFGCACALAEAGAEVMIGARTQSAVEEAVSTLQQEGYQASGTVMDISDIAGTKALLQQYGPFDVVLNCAGIARHKPALESQDDEVSAVLDINLKGAFFLLMNAAQMLIDERRPGSLITMSSQMGHVSGVDRSVYSATKFGVEGFTKGMAIEWGPHKIRVNTIAPTFVLTAFTQSTFDRPDRAN